MKVLALGFTADKVRVMAIHPLPYLEKPENVRR